MTAQRLGEGWTQVRFGEVIDQVKDKVRRSGFGPDAYVPGGSIGRQNFRVSQWRSIDDGLMGPAFHMVARPNDVLYKSRVPHGVAVADRIGICANTTYVLRTRDPDVLLQELIPYLLSTSAFLDFEKLNDKGSTNLYLNFSDVAQYEFALPPLNEQQRIVNVLSAIDSSVVALDNAASVARTVDRSLQRELWTSVACRTAVAELVSVARAGGTPSRKVASNFGGDILWLKSGEVATDGITSTEEQITEEGLNSSSAWIVPAGSPVVAMYGATAGEVGFTAVEMATNQAVLALSARSTVCSNRFLFQLLRGASSDLKAMAIGAAQPNLSKERVMKFEVPQHTLEGQSSWLERVEANQRVLRQIEARRESAAQLRMALLETMMGRQSVH